MSPADRQVVARDPWVPALRLVLDDVALTAHARDRWRTGDPPDRLRVGYVRYKPGTLAVAAVEIERGGHRDVALLLACADGARGKLTKLRDQAERRGVAAHLDEPDLDLLLVPVAADRHLPGAHRLATYARRAVPELRDARPHVLAYKPHRRLVVRFDLDGTPRAVVKAHAPDRFGAAAGALRWAEATTSERLPLPVLLGLDERHAVAVTAWREGAALDDREPERHRATLRGVGKLLGRLHRASTDGLHDVPDGGRPDRVLHGLAAVRPDLVAAARQVLLTTPAPPGPATPIHGDLSADQVVHGDEVALIDLDRTGRGSPAQDLASWVAAEALRRPDAALVLPAALLEGYRSVDGPAALDDVAAQVPAALVRRLADPFRTRHPDWSARTERLLARTRDVHLEVTAS